MHYHAVAWIDHQKATVWQFSPTEDERTVVHAHEQHQRVHNRRSIHGGHRHPADPRFFQETAAALAGVQEILLLGPGLAKQEFANFLNEKHPDLGRKVVAVENADHPTDGEVLGLARARFKSLDRMLAGGEPPPGGGPPASGA